MMPKHDSLCDVASKQRAVACPLIGALLLCVVFLLESTASGQIAPGSPTTQWVAIQYGNNNYPDPSADQQTGSPEADIVGNTNHPSLYMKYNDGGFGSPTNGYLGFRFRLGADQNPSGFTGAAFVGMDVNLDGKLDLFVGVNNQGSGNHIGLWSPGNGLNISPSTTSIVSPASRMYTETSGNYSFTAISTTIDPPLLTLDINADGKTDQFLSFVVPFSDLVAAIAARGISGFTKDTPLRLVAATATQDNSLNQDLNGVTGGVNSSSTWDQLGATTLTYSASSMAPLPEPSALSLLGLGAACVMVRARLRS